MAATGLINTILSSVGALILISAVTAGLSALLRRVDPALRRRLVAPATRGAVVTTRRLDRRRSLSLIDFQGERHVLLLGGPNNVLVKSVAVDDRGHA